MRGRVLFARAHFHIKHQPQPAHEEGVIGVAGPARLAGIVAELGAFLVAVDGLDRHVEIQHPRQPQRGEPRLAQRAGLPGGAGVRVRVGESAPHTVLAAHPRHAQALGIDRVGAQGGDVGVTVLPGENGQRDRAQEIGNERCVGAGELERTSLDPVAKEAGGGQELAEEYQLAQRRNGGMRIPLDVETSSVGVDGQRRIKRRARGGSTGIQHLTLRVERPAERFAVA